jgi:hypothetical protein
MTFDLIEVGRSKFTGRVEAHSERQLRDEIKKHLMSNDIEIEWQTPDIGTIVVGPIARPVGVIRIVRDNDHVN